jgi:hypothetical protein
MSDLTALLPVELAPLPRYLTALPISLLMGLERERNPSALAGLRTFGLTGLFAVLLAQLSQKLDSPWMK